MNDIQKQLYTVFQDPFEFISRLNIVSKEGRVVPLRLNAEQIDIINALEEGRDTLVLKPRQIGSSTVVCAYMFWKAYTSTTPLTLIILSYKIASSKHLLHIHKRFYQYLPETLKRPLDTDNTTELSFKGGGRIIAAAATQAGGLRSQTCSMLHISEYAFAENPEELKATAISALNDGQLVIESTANYYNDALWKEVHKHQIGEADWNYLFFPWFSHKEYTMDDIPISLTDEELKLQEQYHLTLGQLCWRREKISKLGWEKFVREYPMTLDEAYRISGNTYFTYDDFEHVDVISVSPVEWVTFEPPNPDDTYAIGVDVSGGVGRDYAVIFCISRLTLQTVCIYRSNTVSPIQLADYIYDMSVTYNNALVLVESNNYGLATIQELLYQGFHRFWKDPHTGKDFLTTSRSKPLLFENLKKGIQTGSIRMIDNVTMTELRSITVDEKGIIRFGEDVESHCDSAMAMALAYWCLNSVKIKQSAYLPDWIISQKADKQLRTSGVSPSLHRRY
jgi:hypothetical protein